MRRTLVISIMLVLLLAACKSDKASDGASPSPGDSNRAAASAVASEKPAGQNSAAAETARTDTKDAPSKGDPASALREKFTAVVKAKVKDEKFTVGDPKPATEPEVKLGGKSYLMYSVPLTVYLQSGLPQKLQYDVLMNAETGEVYMASYAGGGDVKLGQLLTANAISSASEVVKLAMDDYINTLKKQGVKYTISPDGSLVVYTDPASEKGMLFDAATRETAELGTGDVTSRYEWAGNGQSLYVDSGTSGTRWSDIIVWGKDGRKTYSLSTLGHLAFSPDSARIAGIEIAKEANKHLAEIGVEVENCTNVFVMDVATGKKNYLYEGRSEDTVYYYFDSWKDNKNLNLVKYKNLDEDGQPFVQPIDTVIAR